jgi:hypothetical protein
MLVAMSLYCPRACGLTLLALLCGCHLVFPFDPPGPPIDLGVAVDGAKDDALKTDADVVMDLLSPADGKLPQGDVPQVDGQPLDGPSGEQVATTVPCSSKGKPPPLPVTGWTSSKMRLCEKASSTIMTQCKAADLCNTTGGWSLCEPGDYLNNGGKNAGTTIKAWLKACVRSGGASYTPTSSICAGCNITSALKTTTHWTCGGASLPYSIYKHMGLQTGNICQRVGINDVSTEGFWTTATSSTASSAGAVCCHP